MEEDEEPLRGGRRHSIEPLFGAVDCRAQARMHPGCLQVTRVSRSSTLMVLAPCSVD